MSFGLIGFAPGFGLVSLAVVAPLEVPFDAPSDLLVANGRFFVVVGGLALFAGGGGEGTVFVAGLIRSGLGLFGNVGCFVAGGFEMLLLFDIAGVGFLGTSVFSAGFLGSIFDAAVVVEPFF